MDGGSTSAQVKAHGPPLPAYAEQGRKPPAIGPAPGWMQRTGLEWRHDPPAFGYEPCVARPANDRDGLFGSDDEAQGMGKVTVGFGREHRRQGLDPALDVIRVESGEAIAGQRLERLSYLRGDRLRRALDLDGFQRENRRFPGAQIAEACDDDECGDDERRPSKA